MFRKKDTTTFNQAAMHLSKTPSVKMSISQNNLDPYIREIIAAPFPQREIAKNRRPYRLNNNTIVPPTGVASYEAYIQPNRQRHSDDAVLAISHVTRKNRAGVVSRPKVLRNGSSHDLPASDRGGEEVAQVTQSAQSAQSVRPGDVKKRLETNRSLFDANANRVGGATRLKRQTKPRELVVLPFKVAIMVHLYDSKKVTNSLLVGILKLLNRYNKSNFHWYINIGNSHNASHLKAMVDHTLKGLGQVNVVFNQNRGGDIGGFLKLCQQVGKSGENYGYCYFFHTKTSNTWRTALVGDITGIKLENLDQAPDLGLAGSKRHLHKFTYHPDCHYEFHLLNLARTFGINIDPDDACFFIGGTMFLFSYDIIEFLMKCDLDAVFMMLNTTDTVDANWQMIVGDHLKKNLKGCNNDYDYRKQYKASLHSDFMIEHTFERFIGYIVRQTRLKVYGVGK